MIFFPGCFDPCTPVARQDSFSLRLSVLSGRHLRLRGVVGSAACNAFVRLELVGCPTDCAYGNTAVVQVRNKILAKNLCFFPLRSLIALEWLSRQIPPLFHLC